MSFFVVQRGGDARLTVTLDETFPTREAALAALSAAAGSGSISLDGEVFIADLTSAVPVLVLAPSATPDAVTQQEAEVPPRQELTVADELSVEIAEDAWSPLPVLGDESSLAAALKRAATSLEDEGIVAPASIESAPEDEVESEETPATGERSWPWANVESYDTAADPDAEEPETAEEETSPEEAAPAVEADEPADDEPPVTVAESMGVAEPEVDEPGNGESDAEAELNAELMELTGGDSLPDDSPIITGAPAEGEEAYLPRPVILGDYSQTSTPIEGEADAIAEGAPDIFESVVAETLVAEPLVEEASPIEGGYEAAGGLDLDGYTCQDCVYANTCPKVGQATPADCGSFQWRAE